jgi:hypothetical protein
MITLLTNVAPIVLGYLMKLIAIRSQASTDLQKLQIQALNANAGQINSAREYAQKESKWSAFNRRVIIFSLLALIVFMQIAPVVTSVDTIIPTIIKGTSFLGFEITPDKVEYVVVKGMMGLRNSDVAEWFWLIIQLYFGSTLSRSN